MNSPFYEAEQKALYPHRIMVTRAKNQIADHMRYLVNNNFDTLENLRSTPLGQLKVKYFINASTDEILEAFGELRNTEQ
jgi:hypothetical protein